MADVEMQIELENIHNKNQLIPRLRELFGQEVIVDHLTKQNIPVAFGVDLMVQIALHKRASLSTLIGLLHPHFGKTQEDLQRCADALYAAVMADVVDYNPKRSEFVVRVDIPADVQAELDLFQYPLPMVIEPRKLKHNRSSAYYTNSGSVILKSHNHHDDDVCLDHLNRCNAVKLKLDTDVARLIENSWSNLDHQKEDESLEDFQKRVAAFKKYDRGARQVMELIQMGSDTFHITYRYDKRGRSYAQGYHINPQGTPWNKAVINMAEGELVNGTV